MFTTGVGPALGFAAAWGVTRLIPGLLFGLSPLDPISFGTITVTPMAVTLIASYVPARRALRTDPMVALRWE